MLSNSPTLTSPTAMTGVGALLGTGAYMSPEQAKGRAAVLPSNQTVVVQNWFEELKRLVPLRAGAPAR